MKKTILFLFLLSAGAGLFAQCGPWKFPGFNLPMQEQEAFKKAYSGKNFELSQDYPASNKINARSMPWEKFDFTKEPEKYSEALLNYALDGMEASNWVAQDNKAHKWYHAPWLDATKIGREPIHGMTLQRAVLPGEIDGALKVPVKTWAVSMYNEAGGYTLGQVWCNPVAPDPSKAIFPAGTVALKLVFTCADSNIMPNLLNHPITWEAYVDSALGNNKNKKVLNVRLMQIDIAVKTDNPNAKTGWVFATYYYDGSKGKALAEKFWNIGLQWGQDPGITAKDVTDGGDELKEQWTNPKVVKEDRTKGKIKHLGWGNRLVSPIDNRGTSCVSCHSTAGYSMKNIDMVPADTLHQDSILFWYRNLKGTPFQKDQVSLDYSLELAAGLRNFYDAEGKPSGELVFRGSAKDLIDLFTQRKNPDDEKVVIPTGLSTSRRTMVFIFFVSLILILGGLLVYNLFKKD